MSPLVFFLNAISVEQSDAEPVLLPRSFLTTVLMISLFFLSLPFALSLLFFFSFSSQDELIDIRGLFSMEEMAIRVRGTLRGRRDGY